MRDVEDAVVSAQDVVAPVCFRVASVAYLTCGAAEGDVYVVAKEFPLGDGAAPLQPTWAPVGDLPVNVQFLHRHCHVLQRAVEEITRAKGLVENEAGLRAVLAPFCAATVACLPLKALLDRASGKALRFWRENEYVGIKSAQKSKADPAGLVRGRPVITDATDAGVAAAAAKLVAWHAGCTVKLPTSNELVNQLRRCCAVSTLLSPEALVARLQAVGMVKAADDGSITFALDEAALEASALEPDTDLLQRAQAALVALGDSRPKSLVAVGNALQHLRRCVTLLPPEAVLRAATEAHGAPLRCRICTELTRCNALAKAPSVWDTASKMDTFAVVLADDALAAAAVTRLRVLRDEPIPRRGNAAILAHIVRTMCITPAPVAVDEVIQGLKDIGAVVVDAAGAVTVHAGRSTAVLVAEARALLDPPAADGPATM